MTAGLSGTAFPAHAADNTKKSDKLWNKKCHTGENKKEMCWIEQYAFTEPKHQLISRIRIGQPKGDKTPLQVAVPLGVALQAGLSVKLDDNKPVEIPYAFCSKGGCEATAMLDNSAIQKILSGKKLTASFKAGNGQDVNIPYDLTGVTAAYNSL